MNAKGTIVQMDVVEKTLPNGLTVCLVPRAGFQQTFAMFATKYGSIDNEFVIDGKRIRVPDGIAHFLEHKMFEDEEKEVFSQFAEHGGSVNAFTTFDETAYYFSSTSDLRENLDILLNFVQKVYLTDENVEKEKGIIAQEIRMGDDNPDRKVYMDLLAAMFERHPVRIDIAGSVDSIYQITRQTLLDCFETFYHPSNMILVVAGGFDAVEVMGWIEQNQAKKTFSPAPSIERVYPSEPTTPYQSVVASEGPVAIPRCLIGWKEQSLGNKGQSLLKQELLTGIVLDAVFGKTSEIYEDLLRAGLVDKGFSWEYEVTPDYGYTIIGGNSPKPEQLVNRIRSYVEQIQRQGIDEAAFERAKKKSIGRFLMSLDQVSYVARSFISYRLRGADFLTTADILRDLTLDEANRRVKDHLCTGQMVVSRIEAKQQAVS